jgi:hypothetical protein
MRGLILALCIGATPVLGCIMSPSTETDTTDPTHQSPVDDTFVPQVPSEDPNPCDQPMVTYVSIGDKMWAVEIPTLCTYEPPWDQGDPPPEQENSNPDPGPQSGAKVSKSYQGME